MDVATGREQKKAVKIEHLSLHLLEVGKKSKASHTDFLHWKLEFVISPLTLSEEHNS